MKHIHKYVKKDIATKPKSYLVYACGLPGCNHYVPVKQAEGKLTICHGCSEPFIITRATLTGSSHKPMAKPKCPDCINHKKPVTSVLEFLDKKGL